MASAGAFGQSKKFSALPTTDVKFGKTGRWVWTRTGAAVTATQCKAVSVEAQGLSGSTLENFSPCPRTYLQTYIYTHTHT